MRTVKTLIRLGRWPGWSESSLGAHSFCWFCYVAAQFESAITIVFDLTVLQLTEITIRITCSTDWIVLTHLSWSIEKSTKWHVCPVKAQINLCMKAQTNLCISEQSDLVFKACSYGSKDWWGSAEMLVDLSLLWVHMSIYRFNCVL